MRHQFRRSRVSFKLVQASVDYVKRKGFRKIYGQAQDRLVDFWAHFGAKPLGHNRKITFSDFSYTEMVLDIEPGADAITLDSDPYVIIRPEGDWDRPGRSRHFGRARRDLAAAQRCETDDDLIPNSRSPSTTIRRSWSAPICRPNISPKAAATSSRTPRRLRRVAAN